MTGGVKNYVGGPIFIPLGTDGTDVYGLTVDSDGHLQIDVVSLALPTGAATAALQGTMITALQSIQNLVGALDSVDIDEIVVNVDESVLPTGAATQTTLAGIQTQIGAVGGGDAGTLLAYLLEIQSRLGDETAPSAGTLAKLLTDALTALQVIDGFANANNVLFGFNAGLAERESTVSTGGANTNATMSGPDSGEIFVVQCVGVQHNDTVARKTMIYLSRSGETPLLAQVVAHDPGEFLQGTAPLVMINGDSLVGRVDALANGKTVSLDVIGYKMQV